MFHSYTEEALYLCWLMTVGSVDLEMFGATVGPMVRVHVRVLERVVIGHACLMDAN
jgi:hypothetical protein